MREFVDKYLVPSNLLDKEGVVPSIEEGTCLHSDELNRKDFKVVYMAQHTIFHHVPNLQQYFSVPLYTKV